MSADDQRSTLDVKGIISLIPNLTQFVADVIAISNPNPQTPAASTTDGQLVSAIPSGRRHGGISSSGTQSNAPNREAGDDEGRHPMVTEDNYRSLYNQVDKLFRDLKHVERSLQRLVSLEESVGSQFGTLVRQSRELEDLLKVPTISPQNGRRLDASKLQDTDVLEKFRSLNNMVTQIQDQIPFMYPVSEQGIPHNIGKIPHFNPYYLVWRKDMTNMRDNVLAVIVSVVFWRITSAPMNR
ncbi:hypothetical protein MLD38_027504 [Melastoma candidum]|uniref:Uncharacterized protein n=1 Tax=Melastoma candidum TaxID=119954 RepID=A0ACB9P201_9MYRT|nr:hypothetical protein MLD38_027504 [Melastoma candidum]